MKSGFLTKKNINEKPIGEQIDAYYDNCMYIKKMTEVTMKSKRQSISKFLKDNPSVDDMRMVTNHMFEDWRDGMAREGKAGKTINNYSDHVTGFLRFLQNKRGERISLRLEAIERFEEEDVELPTFTGNQLEDIKNNCIGFRELLLISLVFDSWLRIHEVAKLRVSDIENRDIHTFGKGRKHRDTFITPETREMLDKWMVLTGVTEGYIFQSPTNYKSHLSIQQIRTSINNPIRRAGYEVGSAHAIRRSGISEGLYNGMPLQDAAIIAGHSDPKVTFKHYYRTNKERLREGHAKAFSY